ncbi:MAG: hypothetical protein ACQEQ4_08675 [Fibrobacterota bacterium]
MVRFVVLCSWLMFFFVCSPESLDRSSPLVYEILKTDSQLHVVVSTAEKKVLIARSVKEDLNKLLPIDIILTSGDEASLDRIAASDFSGRVVTFTGEDTSTIFFSPEAAQEEQAYIKTVCSEFGILIRIVCNTTVVTIALSDDIRGTDTVQRSDVLVVNTEWNMVHSEMFYTLLPGRILYDRKHSQDFHAQLIALAREYPVLLHVLDDGHTEFYSDGYVFYW